MTITASVTQLTPYPSGTPANGGRLEVYSPDDYVAGSSGSSLLLKAQSVAVHVSFYFTIGVTREPGPRRVSSDLPWVLFFDADQVAVGTDNAAIVLDGIPADGPHSIRAEVLDIGLHTATISVIAHQQPVGGVEPTMSGGLRTSSTSFRKARAS